MVIKTKQSKADFEMVKAANARNAIRLIGDAEELLQQAKALLNGTGEQEEPDLGPRVLAEVLDRGASVSKAELYEIAEKLGMDRRGLGGFFRQSGKTSLYVLPGDRVVLTPYGAEQARRHAEMKRSFMYEEPKIAYAKLAEKPFAEDWDSEEDSVYDDL
jgi:hypothetical protein